MEHYTKTSSAQESDKKKESHEVYVKSGSKIRTCISHALRLLQSNKDMITISGSGPTVTKAITTAEIVKRKIKGLHQQNELFYTKTEDLWEAKEEGLDKMKVTRNVPSIIITLSTKPLDNSLPGYQAPGESMPLAQFRGEDIQLSEDKIPRTKRQGKWDKKHRNGKVSKGESAATDKKSGTVKQENKNEEQSRKDKSRTPSRGLGEKHGRGGKPPAKRPHTDTRPEHRTCEKDGQHAPS